MYGPISSLKSVSCKEKHQSSQTSLLQFKAWVQKNLLETLSQLSDDEDEDEPVLAGYSQDPYADSQDPYGDLELWKIMA